MTITFSDVLLRDVNAERSDAILIDLGPCAAIQIPQSLDLIAHFVLEGQITIEVESMDGPATLNQGECGLLLYGEGHRIYTASQVDQMKDHVIDKWPVGDEPPTLSIGEGAPVARLLSAALRIAHSLVTVRTQHPLSELLHLKHGMRPFFMDTALLTDVRQIYAGCRGIGASAFINAVMNLQLTHALRCGFAKVQRDLPLLGNKLDVLRGPQARPVAVAARLLRMHPERHWTVAKLAEELGLSRSSFAAKFRAYTGAGPIEYLNNIRMEKASELLESRSELSLNVIARQVGYDNTGSFTRAFKAHFGIPPKSFPDRAMLLK